LQKRSVDLFSSMSQLRQVQGVMLFSCLDQLDTDYRDPGCPAPGIKFHRQGLVLAVLLSPILEPDDEREPPMDYCSFPLEQQPCAPL